MFEINLKGSKTAKQITLKRWFYFLLTGNWRNIRYAQNKNIFRNIVNIRQSVTLSLTQVIEKTFQNEKKKNHGFHFEIGEVMWCYPWLYIIPSVDSLLYSLMKLFKQPRQLLISLHLQYFVPSGFNDVPTLESQNTTSYKPLFCEIK